MRSIWKGHIRLLSLAIPIRIYNAIEPPKEFRFDPLHREDRGPVGYHKQCKKCGQVVSNDQVTRGFQYEPNRYVIIEPEDIARLKFKTTGVIDIIGFVAAKEVSSIFHDMPYFVGPDGPVSERPYTVLREAMKQTGKIGLGKVVLRDREELSALIPYEDGLLLQTLHYPHQIRSMKDVPELKRAPKIDYELKLATTLVEEMTTSMSEVDPTDHFHEALRNLIDEKIKGKIDEKVKGKKAGKFQVDALPRLDLMTALKKSLQNLPGPPIVNPVRATERKQAVSSAKSKTAKKRKVS